MLRKQFPIVICVTQMYNFSRQTSWATSLLSVGALICNIVFGYITSNFGRKIRLLTIIIPMIVSVIQCTSFSHKYYFPSYFKSGVSPSNSFFFQRNQTLPNKIIQTPQFVFSFQNKLAASLVCSGPILLVCITVDWHLVPVMYFIEVCDDRYSMVISSKNSGLFIV